MTRKKLLIQGLIKIFSGIIMLGTCLFLPILSFDFKRAWLFIFLLFTPMFLLGTYLIIKKPALLEKRLKANESEQQQKIVILFSLIMFLLVFVLSSLDYKYNWFQLPLFISIIASIVFLITYIGFIELLRENEYLSRVVEVQEDQQVISTGMYSVVRHPMYSIIFFMFISFPLILGSLIGLIPLIFLPIILIKRINNEEKVLEEGLKGYKEYKKKVKYKLIPFIY